MEKNFIFADDDPNRDEVFQIAKKYQEKRWQGNQGHDKRKDSGSVTFTLDKIKKFIKRIDEYNSEVEPQMQATKVRVYFCQYIDKESDKPKRRRVTVSLVAIREDLNKMKHDIIGKSKDDKIKILALPGLNNGTICPPEEENLEGEDTILREAGYFNVKEA